METLLGELATDLERHQESVAAIRWHLYLNNGHRDTLVIRRAHPGHDVATWLDLTRRRLEHQVLEAPVLGLGLDGGRPRRAIRPWRTCSRTPAPGRPWPACWKSWPRSRPCACTDRTGTRATCPRKPNGAGRPGTAAGAGGAPRRADHAGGPAPVAAGPAAPAERARRRAPLARPAAQPVSPGGALQPALARPGRPPLPRGPPSGRAVLLGVSGRSGRLVVAGFF
ncbi:hypothetical protein HML84_03860 [Alcanivorax sp. IO_7]|nr:hypothetical protein HML84_03860 [Alcanivorax sp. IO_7]